MNFIESFYLNDLSICDGIIDYYNKSSNKTPGIIGNGFDSTYKKSLDISVHPRELLENEVFQKYYHELRLMAQKYMETYEHSERCADWGIHTNFNIQYYKPGDCFGEFHSERTSGKYPIVSRHLVFMTYLNDVHVGGGTEFLYQKMCCLPRKGLTLIWPVDWTHTHRGIVAPEQEKYILTGWFNYIDAIQNHE